MGFVSLDNVSRAGSTVRFGFSSSAEVAQVMKADVLTVTYDISVDSVPESVLAVTFVANFLPFAWLMDIEIRVPELDADFYDCLPKLADGYRQVFPGRKIGGRVTCERRVVSSVAERGRCGVFYSGGLDAVTTLLDHLDERPDLLSVWGADIAYGNEDGWRMTNGKIAAGVQGLGLAQIVARCDFRVIEDEGRLHFMALEALGDGWWHGLKHAIALFGIMAPVAYARRHERLYVASSHCRAMGLAACASNPLTDNEVRFCGCRIVHDGYEYSRQDKAGRLLEGSRRIGLKIPLHVCWETQTGENCCQCEKCLRTITEILVEGGDPEEFGFAGFRRHYTSAHVIPLLRRTFHERNVSGNNTINRSWAMCVPRIRAHESALRRTPEWPVFEWMLAHDFLSNDSITLPLDDRLRRHPLRRWLYRCLRPFGRKELD